MRKFCQTKKTAMKTQSIFLIMFASLTFVSCQSLVTLEDVRKQERKAISAVDDAREETVALAEIKEQYSLDRIKADIDRLEKEQKAAKKDIKSLRGMSTESAVGATEGTVKSLEKRSKAIDNEISALKSEQPETWGESVLRIEQDIESLKLEIRKITNNLQQ